MQCGNRNVARKITFRGKLNPSRQVAAGNMQRIAGSGRTIGFRYRTPVFPPYWVMTAILKKPVLYFAAVVKLVVGPVAVIGGEVANQA